MRTCFFAFITAGALALGGCTTGGVSSAITETDIELASQARWIEQPANASLTHDNYDQLWEACIAAARWRGFRIDRADYRNGLLVTHPLVSKQLFEVWRRDVTLPDVAESTLATIRRIIRFEIEPLDDGTFRCVPKVLVERYSSSERRITSVTRYRESFSIETGQGDRARDRGRDIPYTYWYTIDRDEALERRLADGVRSRLPDQVATR